METYPSKHLLFRFQQQRKSKPDFGGGCAMAFVFGQSICGQEQTIVGEGQIQGTKYHVRRGLRSRMDFYAPDKIVCVSGRAASLIATKRTVKSGVVQVWLNVSQCADSAQLLRVIDSAN